MIIIVKWYALAQINKQKAEKRFSAGKKDIIDNNSSKHIYGHQQ